MSLLRRRLGPAMVLVLGLSTGAVLGACADDAQTPEAAAGASAEQPSSSKPSANPETTPASRPSQKSDPDAAPEEAELASMEYLGGCGWELPVQPIQMRDGRQVTRSLEHGLVRSVATITDTSQVDLSGRHYDLVQLTCEIGQDVVIGYHLVARIGSEPVDLGLLAAGPPDMDVAESTEEIVFSYRYQTSEDSNVETSGETEYRVRVLGNTPIRLYGDDLISDVDPAVADLAPQSWIDGLVGLRGYDYGGESASTWAIGLLTEPNQVLVPWPLAQQQSSCWQPTTYTQSGEKREYSSLAFTEVGGENSATVVALKGKSKAPLGRSRTTVTPLKKQRTGLLVEAQGRVPAIVTAYPEASDEGAGSVAQSAAPHDELLFVYRFLENHDRGGSPGPAAAFVEPDGRVSMIGTWSDISTEKSAKIGMRGMPDPDEAKKSSC